MQSTSATPFLLSFAIPTYNFGAFIEQTILSIYQGLQLLRPDQIEVVVVDGASTDNTESVVNKLALQYPSIRYVKMPQRGGIDFDLNHAVTLAQAPFVWMFSADDVLMPAWDRNIHWLLKNDAPDVILIPAQVCTLNMVPMRRNRIFDVSPDGRYQSFDLSISGERSKYIQSAVTLEAFFSYMSSVLVKRDTWLKLPSSESYSGSCWAHCARLMPLLSAATSDAKIIYLNDFLIQKRTGNDSFMEHGLIRRIGITIDGWTRLINDFFLNSPYASRMRQLMARDASLLVMVYAKLGCKDSTEKKRLMALAQTAYKSPSMPISSRLKYYIVHFTPSAPSFLHAIRKIVPKIIVMKHRILGLFH